MFVKSSVQTLTCPVYGCQHRAYGIYIAGTQAARNDYTTFEPRLENAFETLQQHLKAADEEWMQTILEYREGQGFGAARSAIQCEQVSGDMTSAKAAFVMLRFLEVLSGAPEASKWTANVASVTKGPSMLWLVAKSKNRECQQRIKTLSEGRTVMQQLLLVQDWIEQVEQITMGKCTNACKRTGAKTFMLSTGREVQFETEAEPGFKELAERFPDIQV